MDDLVNTNLNLHIHNCKKLQVTLDASDSRCRWKHLVTQLHIYKFVTVQVHRCRWKHLHISSLYIPYRHNIVMWFVVGEPFPHGTRVDFGKLPWNCDFLQFGLTLANPFRTKCASILARFGGLWKISSPLELDWMTSGQSSYASILPTPAFCNRLAITQSYSIFFNLMDFEKLTDEATRRTRRHHPLFSMKVGWH